MYRMPDENPGGGAFIGIWTREVGTIQARIMARGYLSGICNQIRSTLAQSLRDTRTSLAMCTRIDLDVIRRVDGGMAYCLMGVVWVESTCTPR